MSTSETTEAKIFGHEFSGDIAEVGSQVTGITPGMRVTAVGFKPCGKCSGADKGKAASLLQTWRFSATNFPERWRNMSMFPLPPSGETSSLCPLQLTYEDAASVEPLSISYFSVNRAQPRENEIVAVIGLGVVGRYAVQVLKSMGVGKIIAARFVPSRLRAAKDPAIIIDATKEDAVKAAMEATAGMGVNTVIECAGTQATFDQSVAMVRGGGKIMLVGVYEEPLTWDPLPVIAKNISLIGCLGGNFPASIELLKTGKVNAKPLITHRFPLDQAAQAFKMRKLQDQRDQGDDHTLTDRSGDKAGVWSIGAAPDSCFIA